MGKEGRADVLPEPSSGQTVEHGTRLILNMLSSLMFATLSLFVIVLFQKACSGSFVAGVCCSCGWTMRRGNVVPVSTCSVMLPIIRRSKPPCPCVVMAIRSQDVTW